MFEWLTQAALDFVHQYGYAALFVFIILETAWIIHFVPSEIIIPATAVFLVDDPASFAFFVGVMTVGAILGSLVAYYLFGVSGEEFLREYGHIVKLPESEIERSQAWFQRWGEGLMFWGRVVPVVRTPISIPAGFARMHLGKFTLYSAGGWLVYNAALVWLVYGNADEKAPIDMVVAWLADATAAYGTGVVAGVGVVALAAFVVGWWKLTRGEVSNPVS